MPEIYRQELRRHKLSPEAREAELQQFMGAMAAVNPTIIALRRAEVRQAEALLRVVLLLDETWGRWEYRPATRDLSFKEAETGGRLQPGLSGIQCNIRGGAELEGATQDRT